MRRAALGIVVGAITIVVVVGALALWLRGVASEFQPTARQPIEVAGELEATSKASDTLDLLLWNIGFASLGSEMDFRPDGGRRFRAPSREAVEGHLRNITSHLGAFDSTVFLLQEAARPSWLTHRVDVLAGIGRALPGCQWAFTPTVQVRGLPILGDLTVGKVTVSRFPIARAVRHALPSNPEFLGVTLQQFNVLESRITVAGQSREWVIFNVHLAAFDDGRLRRAQLDALIALLKSEYARGNWVVAGGDWNHRLARPEFPSTADPVARFWVRDLPSDLGLDGWTWAIDPTVPTCRTLERSYEPGVNYTCIIDGAVVSPNVELVEVATMDLQFADSDHQPVQVRVRAR